MIFGIFPNLEKEGINLVLQRLISILDDLGTPYKFLVSMKQKIENLGLDLGESYVSIEELAHADCILSVGGDGSFLGAARTFSDYDTLITTSFKTSGSISFSPFACSISECRKSLDSFRYSPSRISLILSFISSVVTDLFLAPQELFLIMIL